MVIVGKFSFPFEYKLLNSVADSWFFSTSKNWNYLFCSFKKHR